MKKRKTVENLDDFLDISPEAEAKKKAQAEEAKRQKERTKKKAEAKAQAEAEALRKAHLRVVKLPAEIPQEVRDKLYGYYIKSSKPKADVYDLFLEIYNSCGIVMVADTVEGKCEYALKYVKDTLFSKPYSEGNSENILMDFKVFHSITAPTTRKLKGEKISVAYITGVFQSTRSTYQDKYTGAGITEYDPQYGILALYGDAIQHLDKLKDGKTYRMVLAVKPREFFIELAKYDYKEGELEEIDNVVLPSPVDLIATQTTPIDVRNAKFNQGYNRLLSGVIKEHNTRLGSEKAYGLITLRDFKDKNETIKIRFFDNYTTALFYDNGTEVFVLANIDESDKWGLQAIGRDIIPIHETPTKISRLTSNVNDERNDTLNEIYSCWDEDITDTGVESTYVDDWGNTDTIIKKTETIIEKVETSKVETSKPKKQTAFDLEDWL